MIILIAIALFFLLRQPASSPSPSRVAGVTQPSTRRARSAKAVDPSPASMPNGTIVIAPMDDGSLEARWKKPPKPLVPTPRPFEQ